MHTNYKIFLEHFVKARKKGEQLGIKITTSTDNLLNINHFCGASGSLSSFYLLPGNTISTCIEACSDTNSYAEKFIIGEFSENEQGIKIDKNKVKELNEIPLTKTNCNICIAQKACQGGCLAKYLHNKQNRKICYLHKSFFVENLRSYIEKRNMN